MCFDGDACTHDRCADAATGACSFEAAGDGSACDLDGRADTVDTCVLGECSPPPPDPALIIVDPAVLADDAFSFRTTHDRLAADGDSAALFEQWTSTMAVPLTVNGFTAEARPELAGFIASLPRDAGGALDLDVAGFSPAAFVHRVDLMGPGHCGETRVVFTKDTGRTVRNDRMTVIFEMSVRARRRPLERLLRRRHDDLLREFCPRVFRPSQ